MTDFITKNNNLFNNDTFYCCICGKWKPRSEYLYKTYTKYENSCYIAQIVTEIKHFHFGFNYKRAILETPNELRNFNVRALGMLLEDKDCVKFLKQNNFTPDDFTKIPDNTPELKKLTLKLFGKLVWK